MDPALKGTSYGAALEAAERDEQAKRERRQADQDLRHIARSQADTLRQAQKDAREALRVGAVPPVPVSDQEILTQISRAQVNILETGTRETVFPLSRWQVGQPAVDLMAWKLITRHGPGAYALTPTGHRVYALWVAAWGSPTPPDVSAESVSPPTLTVPPAPEEAPAMTATATHPYSEAQINILAMGLEADNARVPKGTAIKRLFDEGLVKRTTEGCYKTTDKGRETWTSLAAAPKATPTPATSPTSAHSGVEVAALHLQLQQTTQLANDRGQRIEGLLDRIEELKRQLEQATTAAAQSPAESEGQAQEIETLKQTIHSLEHQILTLNASLDAIAPLMDEDKSDLPLVMYVQQLRDTIKTHQSDQAAALDLSITLDAVLATSYNTDIADLEYIRDLQATDGQSHLSILGYLVSLREFRPDASPATADPITLAIGEAARQAHKQADTTLSVGDWLRDLIKKAASLDQAAGQIEALRRCIEDLETQLTVRTQEMREVKRHDLAAAILDDLCHLIPAVEEYRAGREQADQALDALRRR